MVVTPKHSSSAAARVIPQNTSSSVRWASRGQSTSLSQRWRGRFSPVPRKRVIGEWQCTLTRPGRRAPSTRTSRIGGPGPTGSRAPTWVTVSPDVSTTPGRRTRPRSVAGHHRVGPIAHRLRVLAASGVTDERPGRAADHVVIDPELPDSSTSMTALPPPSTGWWATAPSNTYPPRPDPRATSMIHPTHHEAAVSAGARRPQWVQLLTSMPACPVGWNGSGSATPENRSAIQWTMSPIDTGMTPAWL